MSATTIFVIAILAAGGLAAAGVFVVAARRGATAGPITGELDARAIKRDMEARRAREQREEHGAVATLVIDEEEAGTAAGTEDAAAVEAEQTVEPVDPLLQRIELTAEEYGVTRRQFLNRAVLGIFGGAFLGGLTLSFLAFLWPKLKGGFGTPIDVGTFEDLRSAVTGGDVIVPKFVAAAQAWIVPIRPQEVPKSQFADLPVVAGAEGAEPGLMALWQRCVHLGCRVPSCVPSQGFECPCHGSRYNFHGEYEAGPAPRNLDRFEVTIDDAGRLIVNTGAIFQTARAETTTIAYPQGPSCI